MRRRRYRIWLWFVLASLLLVRPADAITLQINYAYDTSNFFGAGNPQGATAGTQAKAALEAAASYFSSILNDSFTAISVPAPYHSSVSDGVVTWTWQESFSNPTSGIATTVTNPAVSANQYVVYAGAQSLSGATAGIGGPRGFSWSSDITGTNSFTQADINQINATTASFSAAVETRGQATGFSRWGGSITFDTSARNWSFDHTAAPAANTTDFYSVAIHELAHALGFGESVGSTVWGQFLNGGAFIGPNAMVQNGGSPVPLSGDLAHWTAGKQSVIFGTSTSQEAAMASSLSDGTRKSLTALDAAALKDIGWQVVLPPVPEPSSMSLVMAVLAASCFCRRKIAVFCLLFYCISSPSNAITLQVNYTYDTSNFFGAGNPQGATAGAQAKASLEAAASYFSSILTDSFSAITVPAPLHSSVSDGVVTWNWEERFSDPTTGTEVHLPNPTVPLNHYIIYAGARDLTGNEAGRGGAGGYWYQPYVVTGSTSFTQAEIDQVGITTTSFINSITTRGQISGFSKWGGAITFDTTARTWHYDHTTAPSGTETDFYSVAIHELAHALGFGEVLPFPDDSVWETLLVGNSFSGSNAKALNGGVNVPLADPGHWATGTTSVIFGTQISQEAAMDPDILDGTRKRFTALDAAALKDIGWDVIAPPGANGDYNNNGVVDAADYVLWRDKLNQNVTLPNDTTPGNVGSADYTVWRNNFGATAASGTLLVGAAVPEPTSLVGWLLVGLLAAQRRRRTGPRNS